jgi:hypothetical protein
VQYGLIALAMLALCACRVITASGVSETQTAQADIVAATTIATLCATTLQAPTATLGSDGETGPATVPPTQGAVDPTRSPAARPSDGPDRVWLGGFDCGVTLLDSEGSWWNYREEGGALRTDQVFDIAIDPSGDAWVVDSLGIRITDGQNWRDIGTGFSRGAEAIAVAGASGLVWTVRYGGASVYDGMTWTDHDSSNFGTSDFVDRAKDVALDPQGRAWVATASSVAMFDGESWTAWEEGAGLPERYYVEAIAAGPDGRIWVGHSDGLLVYDGQNWADLEPGGASQIQDVAIAPDGSVWAATWDDGVVVFDGQGWTTYSRGNSGLISDRVRAVAFDAQGRVWIGTTWGLSVFDGANWTSYTMSTSGMAGPCVDAIAVAGDGPTLPQPSPVKVGSLTGLVMVGTEPAEGASIVLCSDRPSTIFSGAHPCADHPFFYEASTDSEGRYVFGDIPVGKYQATWRVPNGQWMSFGIGGGRLVVRQGVLSEAPTVDATPR